jgi:glycine betaine/proline transport system ATP-binding protein
LALSRELNKTTLFITHDLDEAIRMGSRIAIMKDGEIVQTGTPEDIVTNPADDYVADFVQGISKLKLVFAHTVMVPVAKYEKENKKLPALKSCPHAGPEDDLDTLLTKVVDQDKPLIIMDDGKPVGVVTKDALLHAIRGET